MELTTTHKHDLSSRTLLPFFLLTFGIAWGILALIIFFPDWITRISGEITGTNPFFILAVYAPGIAAFILVALATGVQGLKAFFSRLFLWRTSKWWYAFLLIGIPALFYVSAYFKGTLFTDPFPYTALQPLLIALGLMLIIGPVEEFGWRGVALPLLQRRFNPLYASVILGLIWGLWHLPAFFLSGVPQSNWSFLPFFIASVALSIMITPMFNSSGGSLLLPVLYHFQLNNPIWPDSEPYYYLFFVAAAAAVIFICWDQLTDRTKAITNVIPLHKLP